MARIKGTIPTFVKQWDPKGLKSAGSIGLVALVTLLSGCQTNTGDPSIENASFVSGDSSSSSASDTGSSGQQAPSNAGDETYQVRSGDTLYSIAWRHNMKYQDLARLNNINPPYALSVGQQLRLSDNAAATGQAQNGQTSGSTNGAQTQGLGDGSDDQIQTSPTADNGSSQQDSQASHTQQSGSNNGQQNDSWLLPSSNSSNQSSSANGSRNTDAQVAQASQAPKADPDRKYTPAKTVDWQWPAKGNVIKTFNQQTNITRGIDIAGQRGEAVTAAGPGLVVYAGNGVRGYGNLIIIKHNDEYLTAYAHNDTLKVKEGDVVVAGQQIATMGDTEADQVNLHFEIRQNGTPKDPMSFLPKR